MRTIGTSSFGTAIERAGTTRALVSPSTQTKCRVDAEDLRSAAATRPAVARMTDARAAASTNIGSEKADMALYPALPRRIDEARETIQFRGRQPRRVFVE